MKTHDASMATQGGDDDSNGEDDSKPSNINEWGGSDRGVAEQQRYVYSDHAQERSDPLFYDPSFSDLFQTPDQRRKLPAKLNEMLSDPDLIDIISWMPHGRSWRVIDKQRFINEVLPSHFNHKTYASFIRLVNAWGFRRVSTGNDRDSYYHELFLRGMPHLHTRMRRLTFHEKKAPISDEESLPNFYVMPIPDEPQPEANVNSFENCGVDTAASQIVAPTIMPQAAAVGLLARGLGSDPRLGVLKLDSGNSSNPQSISQTTGGHSSFGQEVSSVLNHQNLPSENIANIWFEHNGNNAHLAAALTDSSCQQNPQLQPLQNMNTDVPQLSQVQINNSCQLLQQHQHQFMATQLASMQNTYLQHIYSTTNPYNNTLNNPFNSTMMGMNPSLYAMGNGLQHQSQNLVCQHPQSGQYGQGSILSQYSQMPSQSSYYNSIMSRLEPSQRMNMYNTNQLIVPHGLVSQTDHATGRTAAHRPTLTPSGGTGAHGECPQGEGASLCQGQRSQDGDKSH